MTASQTMDTLADIARHAHDARRARMYALTHLAMGRMHGYRRAKLLADDAQARRNAAIRKLVAA